MLGFLLRARRDARPKQNIQNKPSETVRVHQVVSNLLQLLGVETIEGVAYSKEENSIVERSNKKALRHLRAFLQEQKVPINWVDILPLAQHIIYATSHTSIGVSPAQLLFGNVVHLNKPLYTAEGVDRSENCYYNFRSYMHYVFNVQSKLITKSRRL